MPSGERNKRNEAVFRVILGALGVVGTLVRLYYMRKATGSGQISRKREERLRIALLASLNALGISRCSYTS